MSKHLGFNRIILSVATVVVALLSFSCNTQNAGRDAVADIQFQDTIMILGSFPLSETKTFSFPFTNAGKANLIIEGVDPGCVCTKVTFPEDSIAPGEGGEIKVFFNGEGRFLPGPHDFYIHVKSNAAKKYVDLLFTTDFVE